MCLLAIHFQTCGDAPLLIAANREEFYDRPSLGPAIQPGPPCVLCGVDARAGGTWLGVNQHGVVAAVTNRSRPHPGTAGQEPVPAKVVAPPAPRSRGLLCRELLDFDSAAAAARFALEQLATGAYDGANFACLDANYAAAIHTGPRLEVVELPPGLHILMAGDVNDPTDRRQVLARQLFAGETWASPREFVESARRVCSRGPGDDGPGIVVRGDGRGTVSSTILAVARRADDSLYYFAGGAPDATRYEDCSNLIRSVFSGGGPGISQANVARRGFS